MKKEFSISNDKVMINFSAKYCDTIETLLESEGFRRILLSYYDKVKSRNSNVYKFLKENLSMDDIEEATNELINLFRLLTILKGNEIIRLNNRYEKIMKDKYEFFKFIEDLYSYWRKLERYSILQNTKITDGLASVSFLEANTKFSKLVLDFYRKI